MNRDELAQAISEAFHLRHYLSRNILNLVSTEIARELREGRRVYLAKLGAFHQVTRKARKYYDPTTGTIKTRPPYRDVDFRPGRALLRQIARGRR